MRRGQGEAGSVGERSERFVNIIIRVKAISSVHFRFADGGGILGASLCVALLRSFRDGASATIFFLLYAYIITRWSCSSITTVLCYHHHRCHHHRRRRPAARAGPTREATARRRRVCVVVGVNNRSSLNSLDSPSLSKNYRTPRLLKLSVFARRMVTSTFPRRYSPPPLELFA